MRVLVLKNIQREGPGLYGEILKKQGIEFDAVELSDSSRLPALKDYSALIVMGGPDSANDSTHKMRSELAFVNRAVKSGVPYLGICLGMQVLVKAMGGSVVKNPVREIGFSHAGEPYAIELTRTGSKDALFKGLPNSLPLFHLHGETVVLAKGMELLATGAHCNNQVVKIGSAAYGFQGHLELSEGLLSTWLREDPWLLEADQKKILGDYGRMRKEYERSAEKIFTNFLKIAEAV